VQRRLACALLAASVSAWLGTARAATPRDTLVIAVSMSNMLTLDPANVGELEASEAIANLYDRLVEFDPTDGEKLKPRLADSWTVAPDGTITFRLHPGATFQSGNPVTADDVVWSFRRLITVNLGATQRFAEWGFTPENFDTHVRAPDPLTVVVAPVQGANPNLVDVFGQLAFNVLDRKVVEQHAVNGDWGRVWLTTHTAGSGPFSLVQWQPNDILVMRRFEKYWRGPAKLNRVILRNIPESQVERLQIEHGDIDVAWRLTAGDLDAAAKTGTVDILPALTRGFYYLGLNTQDPVFANRDVREALHWLVDPDTLSRKVAGHFGPETRSLPVFRDQPGGMEQEPWHFDPARARALLAKTPWPNGFSATLLVLPDSPFIELATAIQSSLAQGGIKVNIQTGGGNQVYGAARERHYQMILGRMSATLPFMGEGSVLELMYNPDNSPKSSIRHLAFRSGMQDEEVNRLIDRLRATSDPAAEAEIDRRLQQIYIDRAWPFILLVRRADPVAARKEVHDYTPSPFWIDRWDLIRKQ
jgi:peptide/nickel transport system substrate-binding protein